MELSFTAADEIPSALVLRRVKSWKVAPGVQPGTFTFLRVRGTKYVVGLPPKVAGEVVAEKDRGKVRALIARLTVEEAAAARSGAPSPGKMLLLTQNGDAMAQVTTAAASADKTASPGPVIDMTPFHERMLHHARNAGRAFWDVAGGAEVGRARARAEGASRAVRMAKERAAAEPLHPRALGQLREFVRGPFAEAHRDYAAAMGRRATTLLGPVALLANAAHAPYVHARGPMRSPRAERERQAFLRYAPTRSALQGGAIGLAMPVHPMGPAGTAALGAGLGLMGGMAGKRMAARARLAETQSAAGQAGAQKEGAVDWSALANLVAAGAAAPAAVIGAHALANRVGSGLRELAVGSKVRSLQQLAGGKKVAAGPGALAGAVGGANAGSRHGAVSAGVGGVVGGLVGEYVLPAVEQALLSAGPEYASIAKPAALLASGLAGEISGRLVGNILQPKAQDPGA